MKKTLSLLTAALLLIAVAALPACAPKAEVPQELSFFAMDTYMTLKVYRGERTENEADAALSAAKDEIQRIEKLISVTEESSEIAALNLGEVL
ncbi:MAG: FAD:protein FMN transferase, partial [Clostridia bacterium]|nr:FAD:protein FMN transferase [Clostridia bacterium]